MVLTKSVQNRAHSGPPLNTAAAEIAQRPEVGQRPNSMDAFVVGRSEREWYRLDLQVWCESDAAVLRDHGFDGEEMHFLTHGLQANSKDRRDANRQDRQEPLNFIRETR